MLKTLALAMAASMAAAWVMGAAPGSASSKDSNASCREAFPLDVAAEGTCVDAHQGAAR